MHVKAIGSKTNVSSRKTEGFYFGDTGSLNYIEISLYHQSKIKLDYTVKEMKESESRHLHDLFKTSPGEKTFQTKTSLICMNTIHMMNGFDSF